MKSEEITLFFKQGSTDKVYSARLTQAAKELDDWIVTFAYGRRGKPMRTGTKTTKPVPYDIAKPIYDKLVHAKQLKGYTANKEAEAFADNPNAGEDTGFRPQLLNEVEYEDLETIWIENYGKIALQNKWDGERRGVILNKNKDPEYTNRKGQVTTVNPAIDKACKRLINNRTELVNNLLLDTEDMGEYLVVFDVLGVNTDLTGRPFMHRAGVLTALQSILTWENIRDQIRCELPFYPQTFDEFMTFIKRAEQNNEEGVVIRIATAPYTPGRPNSGGTALKYKFTASATCKVIGHTKGKRSVNVAVQTPPGSQAPLLPICKVTIPPNYDIPEIGSLVEVEYMNIMRGEGAKLFQPRYKGERPDKTEADFYSSLKFKKE